jgi:hypothetical protein
MFRYGQPVAALFRLEHQHSDGTWSTLMPAGQDPHDQTQFDPERAWDRGHVYVCAACQERVRILGPMPEEEPGPPA